MVQPFFLQKRCFPGGSLAAYHDLQVAWRHWDKVCVGLGTLPSTHNVQGGAPSSFAKLVNISPITSGFFGYISIVGGPIIQLKTGGDTLWG